MHHFLLFCVLISFSFNAYPQSSPTLAEQQEELRIVDVRFEGIYRTNRKWAFEYLQIIPPILLTREDCAHLANKLMNTHVFVSVDYRIEPVSAEHGDQILTFIVREKWTLIPVIRGAMGGGTPLRVFGVYDTHAFGSLWTLGAETRKYGTAPNGFITWMRAPRWRDGRYYFSAELWNMPRVRYLFDKHENITGNLHTDTRFLRLEHLRPIWNLTKITQRGDWRYGLRLDIKRSRADRFSDLVAGASLLPIEKIDGETNEIHFLPKIDYDNILQSNLELDGIRFTMGTGFIHDEGQYHALSEFELFLYQPLWRNIYSAFHVRIDSTESLRSTNISYLGGLDSIRGHPDGIIAGPHSGFINYEVRFPSIKYEHAHIQKVVFYDIGTAGFDSKEIRDNQRSSAGVGFRVSSPFIYRLELRVDYAWSLNSKSHGLNIGLGQFFQPYRPL